MSIIVALEHLPGGNPLLTLVEPGISGGRGSVPIQVSGALVTSLEASVAQLPTTPDKEKDALVRRIGEDLLSLLSSHPSVKATIDLKLDPDREHEEPIYLYFKHQIQTLEHWPWEAMYADGVGFLAKDRKFAIARSQGSSNGKTEWSFEPPLRILAVLGASGSQHDAPIPALEQWESLRDAAVKSKLPVELRVLTCERDLRYKINRERLAWAKADLIPPEKSARSGHQVPPPEASLAPRDLLFDYIKAYAPHILHFFSHATADPVPQLEVGAYRDWELALPGSILIDGKQLKQRADPDGNTWLVTLNCCETAQNGPANGALSMSVAAALARQGIPAVVGMREQIPGNFANAFSRLFYDSLLEDLRDRIAKVPATGGLVDIHWACGLFSIRQRVAANLLEWTLPVMHTSYDFKLMVKAPPPAAAHAPQASRTKTPKPASRVGTVAKPKHPPASAAAKSKHLSAKQTAELLDELLQLHEDRKLFIGKKPVVKVIDKRIATITRLLGQATGGSHAEKITPVATGSQRL